MGPEAGEAAGTFLSLSTGMCRVCRRLVQVRYVAFDGRVYLERLCPEHGRSRALVAESQEWYLAQLQHPAAGSRPPRVLPRTGPCPESCGPCSFHAQSCRLPVLSITNACDLRCPICFTYNREDRLYFMSVDEFQRHLDLVVEATGGVDLINITGGEPTLHPHLLDLLERARHPRIGRVTMNTNGLTLARRPELAEQLADLGVYVVLSLDTLQAEPSRRLHGRDITGDKQRALEVLERHGVQTTLLMVLVAGVNDEELPTPLDLFLERDFVRSLTIQTMTYTGQGGGRFSPRQHIPVDGVERRLEQVSGGRIRQRDFLPLPGVHPLCYGVSYLVPDHRGGARSLLEVIDRPVLEAHLARSYLLEPGEGIERELRGAIDRIWSEGNDPELLATIKQMLGRVFPAGSAPEAHERQRRAEQAVKTIYIHAHMDEDTYEVGRAMRCPDQVPVEAERLVGACNYNLFFRQRDERFWAPVTGPGAEAVRG